MEGEFWNNGFSLARIRETRESNPKNDENRYTLENWPICGTIGPCD